MIIIGYQGIGKSSLAGKNNCIDLESGNFFVDGTRDENWYKCYVSIAEHLSNQGYTVFVSSHKVVRDELRKSKCRVASIFPALHLKELWLKKLRDRYESTKKDKDYKAYMNAKEMYDQNIHDLSLDPFSTQIIRRMDYLLCDLVEDLVLAKDSGYAHIYYRE